MARVMRASAHDKESFFHECLFRFWLDLLWLALAPALLPSYKLKARPASTFSLSHVQDMHATAATKLSRPDSCEHGNRERSPLKPNHRWVHLLGWRVASGFLGAITWLLIDPWFCLLPSGGSLALLHFCIASSRMTTNVDLRNGSSAVGYVAIHRLFIVIKILMISIIYVFMTLESHVHISEATNLFLIFFWIKMILKFPTFITITSITNISLILFCAK
jgi:hypothetical protein